MYLLKIGGEGLINNLKQDYISIWWNTFSIFDNVGGTVSLAEKIRNEKRIERFRKNLFKTLKQVSDNADQKILKIQILNQIKDMESSLSSYDTSLIDFFIENGYGNITEKFISQVKEFDAHVDVYDIFQAIRNVWIMNSIQLLYDMEVKLTPSIFAYSMLYPYSDNYLDDSNISIIDKMEFNNRFRCWLMGETEYPLNNREQQIYNLVKMIEEEFDREIYPEVFESLLAIHKAQEQSLMQQKEDTLPYERDILGISFEKGGTSVLADAYLVRGNLEVTEASFMFCYGIILQIIDDLQDLEEDSKNKHMTLFSQLQNRYELDRLINKLINLINNFFDKEDIYISNKAITLKKVIRDCSYIMIFEAVSKNKGYFSKEYINRIESQSLVRLSYLKKVKKKFQRTFSSEDIIKICTVLA